MGLLSFIPKCLEHSDGVEDELEEKIRFMISTNHFQLKLFYKNLRNSVDSVHPTPYFLLPSTCTHI